MHALSRPCPILAGTADRLRTVEQLRAGLDVVQSPDYPNFLNAFVRPLFQVTPICALQVGASLQVCAAMTAWMRTRSWNG